MLRDLYKETYKILKLNLILVQPFLIFLLVFIFVISSLAGLAGGGPALTILLLSFIGLIGAFLAGWAGMFHKCVEISSNTNIDDKQKAEESLRLFKEFTPAIGKYFSRVLLGVVIFLALNFLVFNLIGTLGDHFIGPPESFTSQDLTESLKNEEKALELMNKITDADKLKIMKWNLLTLFLSGIISLFTMYWLPALISEDKGAFASYIASFNKVISRPLFSVSIFGSYWASSIILTFIGGLVAGNFVLQFGWLILFVLVVVYYLTMLFLYYERFSQNSCNSWTDSFR